jgi:hypothetical protein
VEGVAKKTADDFFGKFSQIVGAGGERERPMGPAETVAEGPQVQQSAAAAPIGLASAASAAQPAMHARPAASAPVGAPEAKGGLSPWVWGVGLVVVVGVLWYAFGR